MYTIESISVATHFSAMFSSAGSSNGEERYDSQPPPLEPGSQPQSQSLFVSNDGVVVEEKEFPVVLPNGESATKSVTTVVTPAHVTLSSGAEDRARHDLDRIAAQVLGMSEAEREEDCGCMNYSAQHPYSVHYRDPRLLSSAAGAAAAAGPTAAAAAASPSTDRATRLDQFNRQAKLQVEQGTIRARRFTPCNCEFRDLFPQGRHTLQDHINQLQHQEHQAQAQRLREQRLRELHEMQGDPSAASTVSDAASKRARRG